MSACVLISTLSVKSYTLKPGPATSYGFVFNSFLWGFGGRKLRGYDNLFYGDLLTCSDLKLILRFLYNFSAVLFFSVDPKVSNLFLLPLAGGVIIRLRCFWLSVAATCGSWIWIFGSSVLLNPLRTRDSDRRSFAPMPRIPPANMALAYF